MQLVKIENSVSSSLDWLIEAVRDAQLSGDFNKLNKILSPYFQEEHVVSNPTERAYIYLFTGHFFIYFGKAKNLSGFQEKGRDALTNAYELFEILGKNEEALESKILLGWSFYQEGQIDNFEAFLIDSMSRMTVASKNHLLVKTTYLTLLYKQNRIAEALPLINEISDDIANNSDTRLKCQFYSNAGLIFRLNNAYPKSVEAYEISLNYAKKLKNKRFEAQILNSLAFCLLKEGKYFRKALALVDESLDIFQSLNDIGLKAEALDTKALIQTQLGNFDDALNSIIKAISFFREGESFSSWAEALWNKIEILEFLGKKDLMVETFSELSTVAFLHLELQKQTYYQKQFSRKIIVPVGKNIDEKMEFCEKSIIEPVLEIEGELLKASQKLGFENHQSLSNRIKKYPELKVYLKERKTRSDNFEIKKFTPTKKIIFPELYDANSVSFYQINKRLGMRFFSFEREFILMVSQNAEISQNDLVMMFHYYPYICYVTENYGNFQFVDENKKLTNKYVEYLGKVCGIALVENIKRDFLEFRRI